MAAIKAAGAFEVTLERSGKKPSKVASYPNSELAHAWVSGFEVHAIIRRKANRRKPKPPEASS